MVHSWTVCKLFFSKITYSLSLNFIRLLRVVITIIAFPSQVTEFALKLTDLLEYKFIVSLNFIRLLRVVITIIAFPSQVTEFALKLTDLLEYKFIVSLNFIRLLRVFITPSVTEGIITTWSNRMKFRLIYCLI